MEEVSQSGPSFDDFTNRESHIDLLKQAANALEKSDSFPQSLVSILSLLESRCNLLSGRIVFEEGILEKGTEVRLKGGEHFSDPIIEQTLESCRQSVLSNWRQKMMPIMGDRVEKRGLFQVDRGAQLYALAVPVKINESKMGTISCVKVCFGAFDPKTETSMLSILGLMIGQSAMINRFYPESEAALTSEVEAPVKKIERSPIVGNSKSMLQVFDLIGRVSSSETTVLISGESGVGKELIADALHQNSRRAEKPFVKVNCAALPETLLESELFGHEKGAFTGAHSQKKGRFELAEGGTLFIDEIGDISQATQIKLLRVLQEKEFERLGGETTIKANVRIITATNRNLEELIAKGEFRQDLYYRLNVFPIHIPPLRERKIDIIPITDFFVEKYREIHEKNIRRISTPAIDMLNSYHWPGNVRELENSIERAVLLSTEGVIRGHHLPPSLQLSEEKAVNDGRSLQATLDSMEKELILDSLKETAGNMAKAARNLGLTERVMGLRAKKYDINPKSFKKHSQHYQG
ncbi:MAG: sigma-54-dependent Fis family transcriptional regulator [Pseudobacteriovorax sp.]|nr:sigma-54-dependent Fis family transcriptional regulator [Pseudobacteriovorax sp.]